VLPVEVLEAGEGDALLQLGSHTRRIEFRDSEPGPAWLVLRPEAVRVSGAVAGNGTAESLQGVVRDTAYRGTGFTYRIELSELETHVKAETRGVTGHSVDQRVSVDWDADACWLLPRDEQETVAPAPTADEDAGDGPTRLKEETTG
jgi:ABC-type Fe3+/spermidine/putrescine transport system ATPase subunit